MPESEKARQKKDKNKEESRGNKKKEITDEKNLNTSEKKR